MASVQQIPEGWREQKLPVGMTRRFEFASYEETRLFLDQLAELSGEVGFYPSLNFNQRQVTVRIEADQGELGDTEYDFAKRVEATLAKSLAA